MRTFKQLLNNLESDSKQKTCTVQHSTETPMSAKTQLNIENNLDLVGEYVTHIHTHTQTETPIYLTQLYINTHVCEKHGKE